MSSKAPPMPRRRIPLPRLIDGSALNRPGAVGLAACGPVRLFLLAADHDGLLVLTAVGPVGELVGPRRRDGAAVAGIGVVPDRRLSGLLVLEGLLRRLRG